MNKLKKLLIVLILGVVMVFGIAGCDAGTPKDSQSKKDDSQSQVVESDKELTGKSPQDEESVGSFYALPEAYKYGYLTKTDLKDVCYYSYGEVWEGEDCNSANWTKVEYTPTRDLSTLDKNIETKIKETYYKLNEDKFYHKNLGKIGGVDNLTVYFLGEFNKSYVVQIECSLWNYGTVVTPTIVAGIAFWESVDGGLVVFRAE